MAKKRKGGRPQEYDPSYHPKALIDYFDIDISTFKDITITYKNGDTKEITEEEAAPLPTKRKFCKSVKIAVSTFYDWVKKHKEFSDAYIEATELQHDFIMENTLRKNYNAFFGFQTMKNCHKWRDKTEHEIGGTDGGPLLVKITYAN